MPALARLAMIMYSVVMLTALSLGMPARWAWWAFALTRDNIHAARIEPTIISTTCRYNGLRMGARGERAGPIAASRVK